MYYRAALTLHLILNDSEIWDAVRNNPYSLDGVPSFLFNFTEAMTTPFSVLYISLTYEPDNLLKGFERIYSLSTMQW